MRRSKGRFERLIIKGVLWVAALLLTAGAVFLAGATWEVYQKERGARAELDAALGKREQLGERKETLTADLTALKSERGMEAELRERFPVARAGEEVIVLVDAPEGEGGASEGSPSGFWARIKGWFGVERD